MSKPARLHKVEETNHVSPFLNKFMTMVEEWAWNHATLLLFILMALLTALFVVLMFAICGVSAVESGTQYRMEAWI